MTTAPAILTIPEKHRPEPTCLDGSRLDGSGLDRSGLDGSGLDRSRLDRSGLDGSRLDRSGLNWPSLDWPGLDWPGLDWLGLNWLGLNWLGLPGPALPEPVSPCNCPFALAATHWPERVIRGVQVGGMVMDKPVGEAAKALLGTGLFDRLFGGSRARIFISYRRTGDGAGFGGRIAEKIIQHFGSEQCFRDVESIEPGVDFVVTINKAVEGSDVMILVIGPDWLTQTDADGGRRIDSPTDFVHIELAGALARDTRVIPVLVGGASMPAEADLPEALKGLSRRQAHELTDSRWEYDSGRLVDTIVSLGIRSRGQSGESRFPARRLALLGASGMAALMFLGLLVQLGGNMVDLARETGAQQALAASAGRDSQGLQSPSGDDPQIRAMLDRAGELAGDLQASMERSGDSGQALPSANYRRASVSAAKPRGFSPGAWEVAWHAGGLLHRGELRLQGDSGSLAVRFADSAFGASAVVQQVSAENRGTETVINGFNVQVAGTGVPVPETMYYPDHGHLSFDSAGQPVARFCDFNHTCYPATIRALR